MAQGAWLTGIGLAIGLVASLGFSRLLRSLLHDVSTTDPWAYGLVILVLGVVASVATTLPAWRATRVAPQEALHGD